MVSRCLAGAALLSAAVSFAAAAQDQALIDAAKAEGKVVWYSSVNVDAVVRPMAEAFEEKYGISVEYVTGGSSELTARLVNEAQVGKVGGDVWDGSSTFATIDAAGLSEPFHAPAAENYPADLRDPEGKWYAQSVQYYGPAVNTELVPEGERPRSYEDLLGERWKGKMAWPAESSLTSPVGLIGVLSERLGEAEAKTYLEKLAGQEIANVPSGNRAVLDQTISGQYEIALMAQNIAVEGSLEKGAPIEFLRLDPAVGVTSRIGLVKNGPNPSAGRLFLDFVLSEDGQGVYRDAGYIPASPAVQPENPALAPESGGFSAVLMDLETFNENKDAWVSLYRSLFE